MLGAQWPLENLAPGGTPDADVDAPEAWAITRGSPDIVIAVLDDGVQTDHPDLAANIRHAGRDFTALPAAADGNPRGSSDIHGTAVAGVAAARGNNGLGISGLCPECTILPLRVFRSSNLGTAAAFRYAVEQGADVIVNSWGYTREAPFAADDAVADAIAQAATEGRGGRGAIVVFGVTNEAVDNCQGADLDIASLDSVVAVGVSDHDARVGGSGYGDCLDLVAPAKPRFRRTVGVLTTDRTGPDGHVDGAYFSGFGGTSAAAPRVGGAAALLLSLNPALSRREVQRILEHTADKIDDATAHYDDEGFSPVAGHGRINAARALVPTVRIHASPAVVVAGEPFELTVTASAPYGIGGVWWRGRDTPAGQYKWQEDIVGDGPAYYRRTWTGLRLAEPGTFRFEALVRDAADSDADEAYPHVGRTNPDVAAGLITVTAGGR
jgi:subtilisin family serine protease